MRVLCVFEVFAGDARGRWGRFGVVDLSGFKTEILRFRRNPTFQEKSYVSGEILRVHRNPSSSQKSYLDKSSKGRQE